MVHLSVESFRCRFFLFSPLSSYRNHFQVWSCTQLRPFFLHDGIIINFFYPCWFWKTRFCPGNLKRKKLPPLSTNIHVVVTVYSIVLSTATTIILTSVLSSKNLKKLAILSFYLTPVVSPLLTMTGWPSLPKIHLPRNASWGGWTGMPQRPP